MAITNQQLITQCGTLLHKRYPSYDLEKPGRRGLLAAAAFASDFKVREVGGNNRGPLVKAVLEGVTLDEGYAWCGAAVEISCDVAKITIGPSDRASAAVINWQKWGKAEGRIIHTPRPGVICYLLHPDGTGHMGWVAQVYSDGRTRTYEGNTSAGPNGSQRDGGGWYERIRPAGYWDGYINMD